MQMRLACIAGMISIALAGRPLAHHSFAAEFDASKPVMLTGTVTKVEWANPHTWVFIDVKGQDGLIANWGLEMPGPAQLLRVGLKRDSLKVGDVVIVDARLARDGSNRANAQTITMAGSGQRLFASAPPTP